MQRNKEFYHDDIVFAVEDELFKVDRSYFIQNSPVFRDMLRIPQVPHSGVEEGADDTNPLQLQGISKAVFRNLLAVIYPKFPVQRELSQIEWKAILDLATQWRMRDLRQCCFQRLDVTFNEKSAIERVDMARKYMSSSWLVVAYGKLAQRKALISDDELEQLGQTEGFRILRIQAAWMQNALDAIEQYNVSGYINYTQRRNSENFAEEVKKAFRDELSRFDAYDEDSKLDISPPPLDAPLSLRPVSDHDNSNHVDLYDF